MTLVALAPLVSLEKLSFREAVDTVNIHELMLLQQKQQLDDTNRFLTSELTKEEKMAVDEAINIFVETEFNQQLVAMGI